MPYPLLRPFLLSCAFGLVVQACGGAGMDQNPPPGETGGNSNPSGRTTGSGGTAGSGGNGGTAGNAGAGAAGGASGVGGAAGSGMPGMPGDAGTGPGGDAGTSTTLDAATSSPGIVSGGKCVPLCANASTDPDGDGWGFEKGVSCVVPNSGVAMANLSCQVGGPLPPSGPPAGSAGVAVDGTCYALCTPAITDPDGDGWAYQYDAPCVMAQSNVAATSLKCTIGGTVPVGSFNGSKGRVLNDVCTPFCTTAAADPDGDGFGFQYGTTCVITGSAPGLLGIDCTVGVNPVDPPITLNPNPPPGQVAKPAAVRSRGFFVSGGRIYDKFGNDVVFRGVNNPHIWFDTGDQYLAYNALDNIAALGTNAVRVVWETTGTAALLRRVLRHIVELKMIPIVELHDFTGGASNAQLITAANYYASADVKQVLLDYEEFALLNIANEWSGNDYRNGYSAAITQLRNSGLNHTLVIDANGFGQNAASIFTDGPALVTADPQHNLVFSVHMYDRFGARATVTSTLEQAVSAGLPLIVGEFGWQGGTPPVAIDWAFILSECARLRIGFFPWSWKGNDANLAYLDLSSDWEGTRLNTWGMQATQGANGITLSARRASIFGP